MLYIYLQRQQWPVAWAPPWHRYGPATYPRASFLFYPLKSTCWIIHGIQSYLIN